VAPAVATLMAVLAVALLPSDAADYVVVAAVFLVFGGVMVAFDRLLPASGSLNADAERAFRATQRARGRATEAIEAEVVELAADPA
jgi:hypothetical protein